jgi:hypothetical protein
MTSLDKSIVMIQMSSTVVEKTVTGHNFGRGTSKEYLIQDCPCSYGEEVQNQNVKVDG